MTEAQWLSCTNPKAMLGALPRTTSSRKLRLFAVACCRRAWPLLRDARSRRAVDVAERHADGRASDAEVSEAELAADDVWMEPPASFSDAEREAAFLAYAALNPDAWETACNVADTAVACREYSGEAAAEQKAVCNLLREIFGPRPRPIR